MTRGTGGLAATAALHQLNCDLALLGPRRDAMLVGGGVMTLSARNHLKGIVDDVQMRDVLAHITMRVGDSVIESVITRRSAEGLDRRRGDSVTAVVKATEVMIAKP